MWADLNLLAHWRPEHAAEPNPALLARPREEWPREADGSLKMTVDPLDLRGLLRELDD